MLEDEIDLALDEGFNPDLNMIDQKIYEQIFVQ